MIDFEDELVAAFAEDELGDELFYSRGELRALLRSMNIEIKSITKELFDELPGGSIPAPLYDKWVRWRKGWEDYYREIYSAIIGGWWEGLTGGARVETYQKQLAEFRKQIDAALADNPDLAPEEKKLDTPPTPLTEPTHAKDFAKLGTGIGNVLTPLVWLVGIGIGGYFLLQATRK